MLQDSDIKHIVIIDESPHWRKFSEEALEALVQQGYVIHQQDNYDDYPPPALLQTQNAALVILGCAAIDQKEHELINKIVQYKHHLIVFCTALTRDVMRALFLIGADDVADRAYEVNEFVKTIEKVLQSIETRNAYQSIKEGR